MTVVYSYLIIITQFSKDVASKAVNLLLVLCRCTNAELCHFQSLYKTVVIETRKTSMELCDLYHVFRTVNL